MPELLAIANITMPDFGALSAFGMFSWLIPGFLLGLPGLLIVIVVVAQTIGGSAFVPITRRLLGGIGRRRDRAAAGGDQ